MQAEQVTFINSRGQSVDLNNRLPYLLESIDGKGDVSATIQTTTAPYQDGASWIDTLLEVRPITLNISIIAEDRDDLLTKRQMIGSIFNPKLGPGKLYYSNGSTVRMIAAVVDGIPSFPTGESKGQWFQRATINLIAPNPYWKSIENISEPMASFVEMFEFPLEEDLFEMGIEGHTRIFQNNGDAEVPIKIKIHGPTVNPKLLNNTTGNFIKVNRELTSSDVLEISTENGNKYVRMNGENVFNWIDLESTFWKLEVGANEIQYTSESGQESATLEIEWQEQFIAI